MQNLQALNNFKATIFELPSNEQDAIKILAYTLRSQVLRGTIAYLGATLFILQLQADIEADPTLLNDSTTQPALDTNVLEAEPRIIPRTPIDVPQVPHV